jgi:hypothetical protein
MQQQREGGVAKSAITQIQKGRESQAMTYMGSEAMRNGRTTGQADEVKIGTASTIARSTKPKNFPKNFVAGVNQA